MNSTLQDQVVVVTGASKGIGLACAQAFAAAGAKVALVARSRANLDAALGEIDVLVNSVGAARRTAPDDLNASNWIPKYLTVLSINEACAKSEFGNPGHHELRTRSRR